MHLQLSTYSRSTHKVRNTHHTVFKLSDRDIQGGFMMLTNSLASQNYTSKSTFHHWHWFESQIQYDRYSMRQCL